MDDSVEVEDFDENSEETDENELSSEVRLLRTKLSIIPLHDT